MSAEKVKEITYDTFLKQHLDVAGMLTMYQSSTAYLFQGFCITLKRKPTPTGDMIEVAVVTFPDVERYAEYTAAYNGFRIVDHEKELLEDRRYLAFKNMKTDFEVLEDKNCVAYSSDGEDCQLLAQLYFKYVPGDLERFETKSLHVTSVPYATVVFGHGIELRDATPTTVESNHFFQWI